MAKVEKCASCGSFFNASVYSACPYCSGSPEPAAEQETPAQPGGVLGRISSRIRRGAAKKEPEPEAAAQPEPMHDTPATESAFAPGAFGQPPQAEPVQEHEPEPQAEQTASVPESESGWHVPTEESLAAVVSKGGRTVGKYISAKDGTTITPVVGWLVGIRGDNYGQSFPLKSGKNRVGRSHEMDVKLLNDASVSRTCVAVVVYDQKANAFSVLPGESDSLCYLNGQALYGREPLRDYDCLEFGGSDLNRYLFVQLCGEHFRWKTPAQPVEREPETGDGAYEV